jgi:hypothetical protein
MAIYPTLTVEVAFASNPGDSPVWTDITSYVRRFSTRRGREHELDRVEAGTATLVLDNRDRRFDPNHTGSPYSPNVRPMRRIRARATWSATTYDIFHGFVENWPQAWRIPNDAYVSVRAVDAFKVLNLRKITASYSAQLSGARIGAILDSAGWPAADRDLDVGQEQLQADAPSLEAALSVIQEAVQSDGGMANFFVSRDGKATFVDRHAAINSPEPGASLTWGDSGTENKYRDLVVAYDDTDIWNEIRVTRVGGAVQIATDATSIARYLQRTLERSNLLMTTDVDALDEANFLITRFGEPALRVIEMHLEPAGDTGQWPSVLARDLGDKVIVRRRPPGGGATLEQKSFLEGISHDAYPAHADGGGPWRIVFNLSPTDRATDYWVLGTSVLGTSTRVGW